MERSLDAVEKSTNHNAINLAIESDLRTSPLPTSDL